MKRLFALGTAFALLPAMSDAAETEGRARVSVAAAFDTNPLREFTADGDRGTAPDAFASVIGSVAGSATFSAARLLGSYDLGARSFVFEREEDTLIQSAEVEASAALQRRVGVGLLGRAKNRRGDSRAYSDGSAQAFVDFVPDAQLSVRAFGGAHRFIYWPRGAFRFSFRASEAGAAVRYRIDRRHALHVFGDVSLRTYNGPVRVLAEEGDARYRDLDQPRTDTAIGVGAGWSFRGPVHLSVTYAYSDAASNSYGESWQRHRLSGTLGLRLPAELTALAQLSLQLVNYPDGVFLSPELLQEEDAENFNAGSLKVARPLSDSVDLELKASVYFSRLPNTVLPGADGQDAAPRGGSYLRQLYSLGFTWRI